MTVRLTHRRDKDGRNILFRTNQGDLTPAQIASKIRSGEDAFVGNTTTNVHTVKDDPNYVRADPNNTGRDNLDNLPTF